jgi:hypothetical protein
MKYAICSEVIEVKGSGWILEPWIKSGAKIFDSVKSIPNDYVLISCHHPPWRSPYKDWIANGNKHIEIDYGYWGINNPRRNTRRVTFGGSHNLNLKSVPFSRVQTLDPAIENWKTNRGEYLLLIEPQPKVLYERTGKSFDEWQKEFLNNLKNFWDGPVKWRRKSGGKNPDRWPSFLNDLSGCHAVLGERTMACVEAAILGYPAYTVDFSAVSLLMGTDLSVIKNPVFPDRTQWLEHIAWSQFSPEEFAKGTQVSDLVNEYQIKN